MNQLDIYAQIRNFKDFLLLYNQLTENCFTKCIDEVSTRQLNREELRCVNNCSSKFISANHRMMSIYVEVQSALVNKKIEEAQAAAAAAESSAKNNQNTISPEQ